MLIQTGGESIPNKNLFNLRNAEQVRVSQTAKMQKKIKQMYTELAKEIHDKIKTMPAGSMRRSQLILLERDMEQRVRTISSDITNGITESMLVTANVIVEDTRDFLKRMGYRSVDYSAAFLYVPDMVVRNISNGAIYEKGWTLSSAIWGHTKQFNEKLSDIVARGAAQGKGAIDIAKDLESYVNTARRTESRIIRSWAYRRDENGNWIYEKNKDGTVKVDANGNPVRKKFSETYNPGKVDYNAQRLARTMISHAYQQSFEIVNRHDPFVIGYRWLTSDFHGRVCEICRERAETNHHGLGEGVFPKDDLPLDHPNGMCTFEAVFSDDMDTISDRIIRWYESELGTDPELDRYAEDFTGGE